MILQTELGRDLFSQILQFIHLVNPFTNSLLVTMVVLEDGGSCIWGPFSVGESTFSSAQNSTGTNTSMIDRRLWPHIGGARTAGTSDKFLSPVLRIETVFSEPDISGFGIVAERLKNLL